MPTRQVPSVYAPGVSVLAIAKSDVVEDRGLVWNEFTSWTESGAKTLRLRFLLCGKNL